VQRAEAAHHVGLLSLLLRLLDDTTKMEHGLLRNNATFLACLWTWRLVTDR
jgi:hypothetical protein